MTILLITYLAWPEPLRTPERAAEVFDLATGSILPHGRASRRRVRHHRRTPHRGRRHVA